MWPCRSYHKDERLSAKLSNCDTDTECVASRWEAINNIRTILKVFCRYDLSLKKKRGRENKEITTHAGNMGKTN